MEESKRVGFVVAALVGAAMFLVGLKATLDKDYVSAVAYDLIVLAIIFIVSYEVKRKK